MDESNRNSMKIDMRELDGKETNMKKETYKSVPDSFENVPIEGVKNSNMVREKVDIVEDGADEKMLDADPLVAKKDEVKFISANDQLNGDAKIDIGIVDKSFTGMSKDELMKFANDPFWIKLRWVLFILFWAIWILMLAGAIAIIVQAPKCGSKIPLVWWKQGPLITIHSEFPVDADITKANELGVKGVIYELPGDETYFVNKPEIQERIKNLVSAYSQKNIKVIIDITPNFVTDEDELFKQAKENSSLRTPFIWQESSTEPTNWKSIENVSAWKEIDGRYFVLSQFGENRYDIQMNNTIVKEKFKNVLGVLCKLGVKGFRIKNSKNLIIGKLVNEEYDKFKQDKGYVLTDYNFWTHTHSTFQDGLFSILNDFRIFVKNETNNEGFLSVAEDIIRPSSFMNNTKMGIDLPLFGRFPQWLAETANASELYSELNRTYLETGNDTDTWLQWQLTDPNKLHLITTSEYNIFISLLPGVPITNFDIIGKTEKQMQEFKELEKIRNSASYMYGTFNLYQNGSVIAYTRVKSGNPAYLVAFNPTDELFDANFAEVEGMPSELTVVMFSENFSRSNENNKIMSNSIPVAPKSAIIFSYVYKT